MNRINQRIYKLYLIFCCSKELSIQIVHYNKFKSQILVKKCISEIYIHSKDILL